MEQLAAGQRLAPTARRLVVVQLERAVTRRLRREFGAVAWAQLLSQTAENGPMLSHTEGGLKVPVQIGELDSERRRWPSEVRDLVVRYSDVPQVRLAVPTRPAYVAVKTAAWEGRHAA